jgi:hypothetical protein
VDRNGEMNLLHLINQLLEIVYFVGKRGNEVAYLGLPRFRVNIGGGAQQITMIWLLASLFSKYKILSISKEIKPCATNQEITCDTTQLQDTYSV